MPVPLRLIERRPFAVIGIEGQGSSWNPPSWIQPLWARALQHRVQVAGLIRPDGWGLMSGEDPYLSAWDEEGGRYLAGWELIDSNTEEAPDGWTIWRLPALLLAGLECTLPTLETSIMKLHESLEARTDLRPAGAILEYYPPTFEGRPQDHILLVQIVERVNSDPNPQEG